MELQDIKIAIVTHVGSTGPSQNLLEFCLVNKTKEVCFVGNPLIDYLDSQKYSTFEIYSSGKLAAKKSIKRFSLIKKEPDVLYYLTDLVLNLWWFIGFKKKWDVFVGSDNLNAFCGLLLKKIGLVGKVVYYTIDYIPDRFNNKLLNKIYRTIDILCVKYCDLTWNLSPRMVEGRKKDSNLDRKYRIKQILVPEGVWFDRIKRVPFEKIEKQTLVFIGHLVARLGVQKAIEAVPMIVKKIPNFKFIIIGKGSYKEDLEKLCKKLRLEKHVEFKGFIPDHKNAEKIIANCAVGIAPYSDEEKSFSYYCDPSKTKIYMGCGLPVIMTDIFYNAKEIEESNAGLIVNYSAKNIAEAVINLMENPKKLEEMKKSSIKYIKNLDWNIIFSSCMSKTINTNA
jgi:glycosyltransferase involved in cell wall biosynthesis